MVYRSTPRLAQAPRTIALVDGDVVGLAAALEERGVMVSRAFADRIEVEAEGTRHRIELGGGRVAVRAHRSLWQRLTLAGAPAVPAELLMALHGALEASEGCRLRGWTNERFAIPAPTPDVPVGPERTWATFRCEAFPIESFEDEDSGTFFSVDTQLGMHVARALRAGLRTRGHEVGALQEEEWSCWFSCVIEQIPQTLRVCTLGTGEYEEPKEPEFSVALCAKGSMLDGSPLVATELCAVLHELEVDDLRWWDANGDHEATEP